MICLGCIPAFNRFLLRLLMNLVYLSSPSLLSSSSGFAVTLLFGKTNSERHLEKCEHSYLPATQTGILKV